MLSHYINGTHELPPQLQRHLELQGAAKLRRCQRTRRRRQHRVGLQRRGVRAQQSAAHATAHGAERRLRLLEGFEFECRLQRLYDQTSLIFVRLHSATHITPRRQR